MPLLARLVSSLPQLEVVVDTVHVLRLADMLVSRWRLILSAAHRWYLRGRRAGPVLNLLASALSVNFFTKPVQLSIDLCSVFFLQKQDNLKQRWPPRYRQSVGGRRCHADSQASLKMDIHWLIPKHKLPKWSPYSRMQITTILLEWWMDIQWMIFERDTSKYTAIL